jgi:ribosomal-protein-alanine N-acetyltransferase
MDLKKETAKGLGGLKNSNALIETPRIVLRELSAADDEFILALMNEPAYLQHIGDRGVRTLEDARTYIRDKFAASYASFGYGLYLVELKEKRAPVGICGFVKRDIFEHPDIGFAFRQEYWSRGLAFEAGSAALHHGFGVLGLTTVFGITSPANQSAIRLLEKLGLRYQKTVRVPSVDHDSLLFSMTGFGRS